MLLITENTDLNLKKELDAINDEIGIVHHEGKGTEGKEYRFTFVDDIDSREYYKNIMLLDSLYYCYCDMLNEDNSDKELFYTICSPYAGDYDDFRNYINDVVDTKCEPGREHYFMMFNEAYNDSKILLRQLITKLLRNHNVQIC